MDNLDVARIFDEVADLLEILADNPFRVRAYRNAARTLQALGEPVAALAARDGEALAGLPGIGKDLAGKILEILATGDLALRRDLTAKIPEGLVEMMRVGGIGPKRARQFHEELKIASLDELERAARAGRLLGLKGMGETLQARILQGITEHRARAGRFRLDEAEACVRPLLAYLEGAPGVEAIEVAGSLRRRRDTVGDVDLLVAAEDGRPIADRFVAYPEIRRVLAHGDTRSSAVLRSGLQADLRVVPRASYGAALHYFTGSKAHNIAVRTLGVRRGLKINEYGVFRGDRRIAGRSEKEIYRAVGLPYIPPELREDRGELEAARARRLPALVELGQIRGDLQMHTDATDGADTLEAMARACRDRGYAYMAVTDHTRSLRVARGMDASGFRRQARAIDDLLRRRPGLRIYNSAEVDILPDGRLDLDDKTLASLDLVMVAVHSKFNLTETQMTERVLRALRHPRVRILAHPTGRLLGRREPFAIDLARIARAAADGGVLLEINAQPERLDLDDVHVKMAREAGARFVIDTDAHRVADLDLMRYGVDQARRGWLCAADVANTLPAEDFERLIRTPRPDAVPVVATAGASSLRRARGAAHGPASRRSRPAGDGRRSSRSRRASSSETSDQRS
jgi:DNA polymerase (family 10)